MSVGGEDSITTADGGKEERGNISNEQLGIYLRKTNSRKERLRYLIDRVLAKRWRFFLALAALGAIHTVISGFFYAIVFTFRPEEGDDREEREVGIFAESIWVAWTLYSDPGTQASITRTDQRIVSAVISLGGILFFSSVLGLSVDLVRDKMESIRAGKSKIIESHHTVILGWTEKTVHIISEICKANSSEGGGVIAVLADKSKPEMEFDLEHQLPPPKRLGTRVVFRTGSPLVISDLMRVNVHRARATVILSSTASADQADSDTLRTMLSISGIQNDVGGHIIAEVCDIDNEPLVKLVGGSNVETLVSHDVIGRLMLMSVRQPGLAKVYEALLGFDGAEFYMAEWPQLEGKTFGELLDRFPEAIPIGIRTSDGVITLSPPKDQALAAGDKVIVLAEDNDTYEPVEPVQVDTGSPPKAVQENKEKEYILFCGWRRDVRDILQQLDGMAHHGTEVHMVTHCVPLNQRNARLMEDGLDVSKLKNIRLVHFHGNTSVRRKLEMLPVEIYSSCLIFADQAFESDALHADSHSLATLLLIRDIQAARAGLGDDMKKTLSLVTRTMGPTCPIICEVLDPHTQKTIAGSKHLSLASDFCQTNKLIAQMLAMVSEERTVSLIFDELLGTSGCIIAVVPSSRYVKVGEQASFFTVAKRAAEHFNELVLGYQKRNSIEQTVLNPPNKDEDRLWSEFDMAILQGGMKKAEANTAFERFEARHERTAVKDEVEQEYLNEGMGDMRKSITRKQTRLGTANSNRSRSSGFSAAVKEAVSRAGKSTDERAHDILNSLEALKNVDLPKMSHVEVERLVNALRTVEEVVPVSPAPMPASRSIELAAIPNGSL
eukprot:TRINITY_DN10667_c0_g2_i1.p1 TRINITY_DN10667_c0_g2~~TRINITY_DN10667_c0_g2_i1.p1  ORF type:complete len:835 (-),score=170.48 TRINITY_DN10667_c0_g2_i1:120-2624(-)